VYRIRGQLQHNSYHCTNRRPIFSAATDWRTYLVPRCWWELPSVMAQSYACELIGVTAKYSYFVLMAIAPSTKHELTLKARNS